MLAEITVLLAAAVLCVPLARALRLGSVLGYLAAGMLVGPWGLALVGDVDTVLHFSEYGVVLLLFVIGLELQPSRLWALRRAVLGLGGAQVLLSTSLLAGLALALGLAPGAALIVGFGLAMSSTAFVLQLLAERKELTTRHGRAAFAILLFQDLAIIPFLALIPLLAVGGGAAEELAGSGAWREVLGVIAVFALVIVGGRYLLRPLLRAVARSGTPEVFTACALLLVTATALAMDAVGLSMSLGAFMAGVLLADSEYRHELQADIEPFKGLLLGLFFMAVGMAADLGQLLSQPLLVIGLALGLLLLKAGVLFGLGRATGLDGHAAQRLAWALPQGGEFAFVLFGVAATAGLLAADLQALLIVVVTLTMILSPLLYSAQSRWARAPEPPPYDDIQAPERRVILAGFGPFGQIIGRILRLKKIGYTVLEKDSAQVDFVRRFGNQVYYGDATRLDVLRAAQTGQAEIFVLAIADPEISLRIAETLRQHFPQLRIFAVARTRQHALRLMDLGIRDILRRGYFSSLEMSRGLLEALGEPPEAAQRAVELFRAADQQTLQRQQALLHDEQALVQSARDSARELEQLFEADREQAPRS
jgi:monovalent cation:proton antiporter-2 (CPA2) family protein